MAHVCRHRCAWCGLVLTAALVSGCNSTSAPTGPTSAPPAAAAVPPLPAPGDGPARGTRTCSFGGDEIGGGVLTFDRAAGTMSGWVEPFWVRVRYQLVQTSVAPSAATFAARFGTNGVLEGRFFVTGVVNVAVWSTGGGEGYGAVNGFMTGVCEG
jgi:hypothetical protein